VLRDAPVDSISILDFSTFPTAVEHISGVPNSVIGPPSNIAITPDGRLALIANSLKVEPTWQTNWVPENFVHLLDLTSKPPRVIGVSRLAFSLRHIDSVAMESSRWCQSRRRLHFRFGSGRPAGHGIAIRDDLFGGRQCFGRGHCAGQQSLCWPVCRGRLPRGVAFGWKRLGRDRSKAVVYGQPYRCVITPDGELGLTAGQGFGNGLDHDALT
jgi:hypothetical protein